jgi:hypothetical protein
MAKLAKKHKVAFALGLLAGLVLMCGVYFVAISPGYQKSKTRNGGHRHAAVEQE